MLASFLHQHLRPLHPIAEGRAVTCHWLAGELARHHAVSFDQAFAALQQLSPNLFPMLDGAEGVTALGFAASLLFPDPNSDPFIPTIH